MNARITTPFGADGLINRIFDSTCAFFEIINDVSIRLVRFSPLRLFNCTNRHNPEVLKKIGEGSLIRLRATAPGMIRLNKQAHDSDDIELLRCCER